MSARPSAVPQEVKESIDLFKTARIKELKGHTDSVHSVSWSLDGRKLASSSNDKSARIWDIERYDSRRDSTELRGHTESVDQTAWDPVTLERLVTVSVDKTFRVWDTRAPKCTHIITTGGANIFAAWKGDGNQLAICTKDDNILIYDTRAWRMETKLPFNYEINEVSWNLEGDLFLIASLGTIAVHDFPALSESFTVNGHTVNCNSVKFDPKGKYFASGGADAIVSLWDVNEFVCVRTFVNAGSPIRSLGFSHDGQFLAYASEDPFIEIAHVESGLDIAKIPANLTNAVAWHPTKHLLAYATEETDVRQGLKLWGLSFS